MIVIADKIAGKISRNAVHLVCIFFTHFADPLELMFVEFFCCFLFKITWFLS